MGTREGEVFSIHIAPQAAAPMRYAPVRLV
jgi:hypothetical protein